jgi:cytoskeleton protein RodZ
MSSSSRLTQLQDRLAAGGSRLQINEIVEDAPVPEYDNVGLELKAHRERKGHELEMAGRVLRIKKTHIRAIEESRFKDLPGKTYAIGFVRSYAEYLGLNPDDCIRRFKLEYNAATLPKTEDGKAAPKPKLGFPDARQDVRMPHGSLVILAGILVLGVWGGWYLTTSAERQFNDAETVALPPSDLPTPEDAEAILRAAAADTTPSVQAAVNVNGESETQTEGEATEVAASDGGAGDAIEPEGPATHAEQMVAALTGTGQGANAQGSLENGIDEVPMAVNEIPEVQQGIGSDTREAQVFGARNNASRVIIRARGAAWVRIEDTSGAVLFEETLIRGDSYRVPNRAGLIMATRNAGAVELLLDGRSLGPVGAVGQPLPDVSLDAGALEAARPELP